MSRTSLLVLLIPLVSSCFSTPRGDDESGDTSVSTSSSSGMPTSDEGSDGGHSGAVTSMGGSTTAVPTTSGFDDTGSPSSDGEDDSDDDEGGSSTGAPECDGIGPAGMPGVNPGTIWIANASQSTISKIDTATLVEHARYLTRPDGAGNPSRTAVSLDGDVVVANRSGGLAKFYGDPVDCVDIDGNGVISTSSDGTALPWDDEECRAWYVPMDYTSQRPVAWTAGLLDETTCERVGEKVWTAGVIASSTIEVRLVDGETGVIEQSIQIPEIAPNGDEGGFAFGLYGTAVDAQGDLWASMLHNGFLVHVDRSTMDYQSWPLPLSGYGMTVGSSGYVFVCSGIYSGSEGVARFDPDTETWLTTPNASGSGCVEDGMGRLWLANDPVTAIDVETLAIVQTIDLPEYVHGVAVDFQGMIWGVGHGASTNAYRMDPATGTFNLFGDLVGPYTYSDMTGFVLASVVQ